MPKYTYGFLSQISARAKGTSESFIKDYEVEVDGGFAEPPLLECARALTDAAGQGGEASVDTKDKILRYSIFQRMVTIRFRGKELGKMQMNSMTDQWDNFPVLKGNASLLMLLQGLSYMAMVEKSLPPSEGDQPVAARATPGSAR